MADSATPTDTTEPNSQPHGPDNSIPQSNQPDLSSPPPPCSSSSSTPPITVPAIPYPNPTTPSPPSIQAYGPPQVPILPPTAPSFRPAAPPVPVITAPQFSPLPNLNFQAPTFQNHGVQPPGVNPVPVMMPSAVSGASSVGVTPVPPPMGPPYVPYGQLPNPAMRPPYAPMPNGYPTMPGTIPPPGIRYLHQYTMVRPVFPPRPTGAVGIIPVLPRPPVSLIRGQIGPPVVRPAVIPSVTPAQPQTTVYVGKIATVENDFMLSLLQVCGPVKSWKRYQDPTSGALKGFGFCEFDSAEGVLRALRLLSKVNIDGQELMLNVNESTRKYLELFVEKKRENSKNLKANETEAAEKEEGSASDAEKNEPPKPSSEDSKEDNNDTVNKENHDISIFGLVTDEDRKADQEALEKLTGMIDERLRTKPLPPPPPPPQTAADGSGNSNLELPARSRDGDSDVDIMRNDAAEDRNDDEMTSESKPPSEHDIPETSSPDRSRRNDRRGRDRERDVKREKERELERYEREREQDRAKREREREYNVREDERRYRMRVKEWESREREKEHLRKVEKEREKEREQKRKWEIMDQEPESDEGYSKKRKYKSSGEERKRRLREKEEDMADRLKEEEEIAEAKRRFEEEQQQKLEEKDALKFLSGHATNGSDKAVLPDDTNLETKDNTVDQTSDGDSGDGNHIGDGILQNGTGDESVMASMAISETMQSSNAPTRKLGFGLLGSGRRTAVPSVFHEEDDEDAQKDKKMRPLVPIDYSTEELQAVRHPPSGAPSPNLVAAAEFAKRISNVNPKEERPDAEKERSRRPHNRSSQRDRDRKDEDNRTRDESRKETVDRDKDRAHGLDKVKTPDNQKLLDAKQLIDTIPKTKDELFSHEINWSIYDKNELREKMRPWISKKITEFLGEEETTLVDYIVSSTQEHVTASVMLERLQAILDDEAEMFVLKMWRMLIFEIKRVETGLALQSKT